MVSDLVAWKKSDPQNCRNPAPIYVKGILLFFVICAAPISVKVSIFVVYLGRQGPVGSQHSEPDTHGDQHQEGGRREREQREEELALRWGDIVSNKASCYRDNTWRRR